MPQEVQKLQIQLYDDPKFEGSPADTYEVMINPENYKLSTKVKYNEAVAKGNWSTDQKFQSVEPAELNIKFTIDGTGVSGNDPDIGSTTLDKPDKLVQASIDHFLDLVRNPVGKEHRPRFAKIAWGDLIFKGVFISADIDYTYFHASGRPLRAVISATFSESIDGEQRVAKEKKQSPDLTHVVMVREGETLTALCKRVYRDPTYYLEVARVNKLDNFRSLYPGQELVFPPISKTE